MRVLEFAATPASAYRADIGNRSEPFGPDDDSWLAVASAIHQASLSEPEAVQLAIFEALSMALDAVGEEEVDRLARREWEGERSKYEALMLLADRVHEAGALHLAARMMDDLLACALPFTTLERGRLLAFRARVEWKLGHLDAAVDRYRYLESLGDAHGAPELVARARVGLVAIAQIRGNIPELIALSDSALKLAERHGLRLVARRACQGLTVGYAQRGEFDDAFVAAWRTLEMSGEDAVLQSEALQNLGQLMLVSGHLPLARASFSAVVARPVTARTLLPALGGLVVASARLGAEPTVEWAMREIWRAQAEAVPQYELSVALIEASGALRHLGRRDDAERYRQAALRIAEARGFHEVVHAANQATDDIAPSAAPLGAEATAIGVRLAALEPPTLPARLAFDRVSV